MQEGVREWRGQHLCGMRRRGLDEVAEHVVVPDLERGDSARLPVLRLKARDHPPAFVAQPAGRVEGRLYPEGDEPAIAGKMRRLFEQHRLQPVEQRILPDKRSERLSEMFRPPAAPAAFGDLPRCPQRT